MRFQIPSQTNLHRIVYTHRSLALLPKLGDRPRLSIQMAFRKSTGARPAIRVGGVFEKKSAGSLASGFLKTLLHLCSKLAP